MTDKKRRNEKPRVLGAPYVARQRVWGEDAYLEFARKAWPDLLDPADDGPEIAIILRERAFAQEESDVRPRK